MFALLAILCFLPWKWNPHPPIASPEGTQEPPDVVIAFWKREIQPIEKQLNESTFPVACVNNRFQEVGKAIVKKYGKPLNITAVGAYNPISKEIFAACRVENGAAVARTSIPSLMDTYRDVYNKYPNWHEEFELDYAVGLLHELEHFLDDKTMRPGNYEDLVRAEAITWANTCRYTLDPLALQGKPVYWKLMPFERAWVECGRQEGPKWTAWIRSKYSIFNRPQPALPSP